MNARLPLALALLAAAAPSDAAERSFTITGFDRIRVEGPYRVSLRTGVAPFAKANGSSQAIDGVSVGVQGRTLIVRPSASSWGGYPGKTTGPVEVIVGTHDLSAAWLNGAGSLEISAIKGLSFDLNLQGTGSIAVAKVTVDQLRVNLSGSGVATLAGTVPRLSSVVRGSSSLDASGLKVKDAVVGAEGPAVIRAHVTNSAKVDASGVAQVDLAGSPACTAKVQGSATVNGCK